MDIKRKSNDSSKNKVNDHKLPNYIRQKLHKKKKIDLFPREQPSHVDEHKTA